MDMEIWRQNIIIPFSKYRYCVVSFLEIHKLEPDIYIVLSPALRLQCIRRRHFPSVHCTYKKKKKKIFVLLLSCLLPCHPPREPGEGAGVGKRRVEDVEENHS
jgi:hypothetical protein